MPRLMVLFALAVLGTLAPVVSPAAAAVQPVGPPQTFLRGNLAIYTTTPEVRLRLDPAVVNMPDAQGEENRSWDIQLLRADMRATSRPGWRTGRTRTNARHHVIAVSSGQILCIRARQHSWGVTGSWSSMTCVVRARDDEHLRREGAIRLVNDVRYADGRASVLRPRTRMSLSGVPAGALYGPVFTKIRTRSDGSTCAAPSWRIAGQREPSGSRGVSSGALNVWFHHTNVARTAVIRSPYGSSCPVGGFVVVPKWMPR